MWERLRRLVRDELWSREPLPSAPRRWARKLLQLGALIARGVGRDQLLLRAHSLTFLTILSLVPLLALAVSMVELFGVSENLTRIILELFAAGSPESVDRILPYVRDLDFGRLGTLGAAALVFTTLLTIGAVEAALNAIWGVQKQRPWTRRVPDYLAVVLIAPLVLGVAISSRATLESQWIVQRLLESPSFSELYGFALRQAPTLLIVAGLSFVYWFLPNTEVRFRSALLGGLVGGVLFTIAQVAYIGLNVGAARYNAVFGGVAFLPLLLVWIYFEWLIMLIGAEVAFAHQQLPLYRREVRAARLGQGAREVVGIAVALQVARLYARGEAPVSTGALSEQLDVPVRNVREVAAALEEAGILAETGLREHGEGLLPARPLEQIQVADVLRALRGPREVLLGSPEVAKAVAELVTALDEHSLRHVGARDLAALVASVDAPREGVGADDAGREDLQGGTARADVDGGASEP